MSGGGKTSSTTSNRVTISEKVMEVIKTIKEIAGNSSDEEIHAMLKECGMDPNETAQRLLAQDPFLEVKRKRDKRKENLNNKDISDAKWRTGPQGRGGRGGKGNFPPRNTNDAGDARMSNAGKENGVIQGTESKPLPSVSSSLRGVATVSSKVTPRRVPEVPMRSGANTTKKPAVSNANELGSALIPPPPPVTAKAPPSEVKTGHEQSTPSSDHVASPVSVLGVYSSASDPILVPSLDARLPGTVGTIKCEVGSQRTGNESSPLIPSENKFSGTQDINNHLQLNKVVSHDVMKSDLSSSISEKASPEIENSLMHGKMPSKSHTLERNQSSESAHSAPSSRPSSNYGSRSQQVIGSQKVGPSKEWKPKPTNPSPGPSSAVVGTSELGPVTAAAGTKLLPALGALVSEESNPTLQEKLDELHLTHNQQVIIPDHLQVPEAERTGLSFGSFHADFGVRRSYNIVYDAEKSSPLSESSQEIEEIDEEPCISNQVDSSTAPRDYSDHPQSPKIVPDNLSLVEADASSSTVCEYGEPRPETTTPLGGPPYSVHTVPNYNIGLMPPILGTQFAPFDSSEPQARDASRLPSFVVQQPFDPSASYYTQFYRPSTDGDGRFSPFHTPGAANKYNGNIALLSSQTGQAQESGNSLVLSTAGPTPLATQAAGIMQSSLGVTQQPVPVFRQPSGVHVPHYPPNYIPYNQYFSPFYVPPQTIHHYLTNPAYPQQPPTGSVYSTPTAAAPGVKYSLSQYKPVTNTSNSTHVGIPSAYAPYSSSPTGYSPTPVATTSNSTGSEDLSASQYKENNVYVPGQQSEGSALWIPAPGRDISALQASSFYNLSPQGQHVTFAPTQANHGAFTGIYHPTQTMAATAAHPLLHQSQTMVPGGDMAAPPAGVYQQPQHAQMNWSNNYS
ncbi:hypothetical protein IFM89_038060 [Coptis chinensis]|uniref:GBF-interacting protein 1 N-terminal domain-containing protein n=1 Tax=Coptis chinensis TaxID=261450 RepID=A0A835H2V1_9MAGN|nr:hypothetical protein IFM89_038060 [Coptis chinensis]